jgi:hypothetical protein
MLSMLKTRRVRTCYWTYHTYEQAEKYDEAFRGLIPKTTWEDILSFGATIYKWTFRALFLDENFPTLIFWKDANWTHLAKYFNGLSKTILR